MRASNGLCGNIIPANDTERINALHRYHILNTPAEYSFDKIALGAAQIFHVPIALISLVDEKNVFFKANIGLGNIRHVNRAVSLCARAILNPEVTVFEDTLKVADLRSNLNTANEFDLRFYAGAPLITRDGYRIGTLCIADKQPKHFNECDKKVLKWLAKKVMEEIEYRTVPGAETEKYQDTNQLDDNTSFGNDLGELSVKGYCDPKNDQIVIQDTLNEHNICFNNIIKNAPVAFALLTSRSLIIESANDTLLKIFGKTKAIIGLPVARAFPESERKFFLKQLNDVYSSGQDCYGNETKVIIEYNGQLQTHDFNFVYHPILNGAGESLAVMIVANDVTGLVNARNEKEKAEEMLKFAIEAANVGTWHVDMVTGTFIPSSRLKEIFGFFHEDEMPYELAVNQIVEEYRERVLATVRATLASGIRFNIEFPLIGFHDQKLRWVRAVGKLNRNDQINASNYSGVITDITEEKQDELRKNDFIAMVSHELKTPLSSLKLFVQLLDSKIDKSDDNFVSTMLKKINTQLNKMNSLVNGFLNLSSFESGKIQLHKSFFNLGELVKEIINETRLVSSNHVITLTHCDDVPIHADREKISQVITNFLSNADKYSPKGELIEVKCLLVNDKAQVSVKDEGMGIKPQYIEKLFERYFRVESKHTSNISGFGIGLYICSEIIHVHGGFVKVDSEIGKGSTFYFTLPLFQKDDKE